MVSLDRQLIYTARHLINGANVHRLKEMIFAYEQAVDLHNRKWPGFEIYRVEPELRLRNYVREQCDTELARKAATAINRLKLRRSHNHHDC